MGDMSTIGQDRPASGAGTSLTPPQDRFWRQWLALNARVPIALNRQLQEDSTLSLQDFEVLVQLSESPTGRLRVTELATALAWERSRVSHHVTRMTGRGLVERQECQDDGRGALVVVSPEGRAALEQAAPAHVRTVHELVFASMDDTQVSVLTAFAEDVLARLTEAERVGADEAVLATQ